MNAAGYRQTLQSGTSPLSNDTVAPTALTTFVPPDGGNKTLPNFHKTLSPAASATVSIP